VRREVSVLANTVGHRQSPAYYDEGADDVCLAGCTKSVPAESAPEISEAAREWARVDRASRAELETFVRRHGASPEADYARARIEALKRQQLAAAPPKVPEPVNAKPSQPATAITPAPSPPARCEGIEITVGQGERRCFKPGEGKTESFKDCPACPEMVVVPGGSYTMGSPANEPERDNNEAQVRVTIPTPFAAGKFAITFKEWDACVADGGCNGYKPADQGWGRTKHPVININWDSAKIYTTWLSHKTGKTYRLLSEAEREYVTRAGTTTPFWWGWSITPKQANYNGTYTYAGGASSRSEYRQSTVPVDSFEPNAWGLYNVHGNIREWTEDCWNESNSGNPGDGRPRTTGDCALRVVRGGSWNYLPQSLRSASRYWRLRESQFHFLGLRVARTLP
jgi:formylglycine-generating enzyme required for sulfatase activity